MNKEVKRIRKTTQFLKEQSDIEDFYYRKGCAFCCGEESFVSSFQNVKLNCCKNTMKVSYDTAILFNKKINFCPFCGKKLQKKLSRYPL